MKLDCILTAVNENTLYLDFIPIFIKTWNKLYPNVDVKIILVANKIPDEYLCYKDNIILFEPIENVLTNFTSQIIRLLYPCILNYENGVMITDMDMLPMNRTYYTENIKSFDNSKFIYLRENICFEYNQLAMCYNVAVPKIWKEIFEINSVEDIRNRLKSIRQVEWCTDQLVLYKNVMEWNNKTNNLICLKENSTGFKRLDRNTFGLNHIIKENVSNGVYSDYHCYRPMSEFSEINYQIYNLL
jgi:hypothetical protein